MVTTNMNAVMVITAVVNLEQAFPTQEERSLQREKRHSQCYIWNGCRGNSLNFRLSPLYAPLAYSLGIGKV